MHRLLNFLKISYKTITVHKGVFFIILFSQVIGCMTMLGLYSFVNGSLNPFNTGVFTLNFQHEMTLETFNGLNNSFMRNNQSENVVVYFDNNKQVASSLTGIICQYPSLGEPIDATKPYHQAVVPNSYEISIGESIELLGNEYRVVGKADTEITEINLTSLPKTQPVFAAEIVNYSLRSKNARTKYIAALNEVFQTQIEAKKLLTWRDVFFRKESLALWIPAASVIISFLLGYGYIIIQRAPNFEVYRLLGQSRRNLTVMLISEILILSIVQYLFSVFIYLLFDILILDKMKNMIVPLPRPDFAGFVAVGVFYALLTSMVAIAFALKAIKNRRKKNAFT